MNPVLTTERLVLRVPDSRDEAAFLAFATSEGAHYIGGPMSEQQARVAWYAEIAHWKMHGYGRFAVVPKGTEVAVGLIGPQHPMGWPECEMNWYMFREGQGHGYAIEAGLAVRDWIYATLGWPSIVSYMEPGNLPSIRLAERLGATLDPEAMRPGDHVLTYRHPNPEALQ